MLIEREYSGAEFGRALLGLLPSQINSLYRLDTSSNGQTSLGLPKLRQANPKSFVVLNKASSVAPDLEGKPTLVRCHSMVAQMTALFVV